jgi:hypothetical protein
MQRITLANDLSENQLRQQLSGGDGAMLSNDGVDYADARTVLQILQGARSDQWGRSR